MVQPLLVKLPKTITIANKKVNILYYLALFGILGFFISSAILNKHYFTTISVSPSISYEIVIASENHASNYNFSSNDVCNSPEWRIVPNLYAIRYRCLPWCTILASQKCLEPALALSKTHAQEVLVLVSDTTQQASLGGFALPDTSPSETAYASYDFELVPASQVVQIKITYKAVMWSAAPVLGNLNSGVKLVNTNDNVATIIIDRFGAVFRRFEAKQDIVLSTAEILYLAAYHLDDYGLLSRLQGDFRGNLTPANVKEVYGSRSHFPRWVFGSGAEVRSRLECFNDDLDAHAAGYRDIGASLQIPACVLTWKLFETSGQSRETEPVFTTGVQGSKKSFGVRIMTAEYNHGTFRAWDLNKILLQLTSLMVLLQTPKSFIAFVIVTFLGHLSVIYSRATEHRFNIIEQISTSAFKVVQNSMLFEHLADACDGDSQTPNSVSKAKLQSLLLKVAQSSNMAMTEEDICFMTDFCVKSVAGPHADRINFCQFQEALLCNDSMGLSSAFNLFSQDRKRWLGERAFTPPLFSRLQKSARLEVKDMDHETPHGQAESIQDSSEESQALKETSWVTELRRSQIECEMRLDKLAADVQLLQQSSWESQAQRAKEECMDTYPAEEKVNAPQGSGCQAKRGCDGTLGGHVEQSIDNDAKEGNEGISPQELHLSLKLQRTQEACDMMLERFRGFMDSTQRSLDDLKSKVTRDEGFLHAHSWNPVRTTQEKKTESHGEQSTCKQDMSSNDQIKQLEMQLQSFQNRLRDFEVKQDSLSLNTSADTDLPDKLSKLEGSVAVIFERLNSNNDKQSSQNLFELSPRGRIQTNLEKAAPGSRNKTSGGASCLRRHC